MALQPGDKAPDFALRSHRGGVVKLSDYRGHRNVVLAFHPLAFTPVCATQMSGYQADVPKFDAADTTVLGVSIDPQPAKTAWGKELGVTSIDLLSDNYPYGEVAKMYGVFRETDGISDRAVFLIDKTGTIRWAKVYDIPQQPANDEVFAALAAVAAK
jgi:peroxiredoxin